MANLLPVGQAMFVELQEQPLSPLVVIRGAGVDLLREEGGRKIEERGRREDGGGKEAERDTGEYQNYALDH